MKDPMEDINRAPLPTEKTLKMRKRILFQFFRFAALNLKMVRMIRKGHHPME